MKFLGTVMFILRLHEIKKNYKTVRLTLRQAQGERKRALSAAFTAEFIEASGRTGGK